MSTKQKPVNVVIVGLGWAGSILAKELSDAGQSVVVLERGPAQSQNGDFNTPRMWDDLRYNVRLGLMTDLSRETITFRNEAAQTALPMRQLGSFIPGTGTGGSGVTWSGHTFRQTPDDLRWRSHLVERYGRGVIPEGMTIQDYPVTFDELEPFYDRFEQVAGTTGKAGNLGGRKLAGGNPFEGPRSAEYPNPPLPRTLALQMFEAKANELGYHPFPIPVGNMSRDYTNPYGVSLNECRVCNHCSNFACAYGAKSSPNTCVVPALSRAGNVELRHHAYVTRVNRSADGRRATGVVYLDAAGRETEQPAEIVILAAFAYNNPRLLMLSNIGKQYNPQTSEGTLGRNYAYQTITYLSAWFKDRNFNPFVAGGGLGTVIDDLNGDNFDHTGLGFVGGGFVGTFNMGGLPIQYHPSRPEAGMWGSGWKRSVVDSYQRVLTMNMHQACQSYRGNFLDLDPTYRDASGQPLLRMTFDFGENEHRMSEYITDQAIGMARAMGAESILETRRRGRYEITHYQTTHNVGGAVMGDDPKTSVVNRYLQHWDVPNLFVVGSSAFPQNSGYNPTGTVGALAYWTAEAIRSRYLKNPGALVS